MFGLVGMLIYKANGPPPTTPPLMHFELELTQPLQTVARRRLGCFFSSGSGPGGSGWRHAARDKHWVELLYVTIPDTR